MDNRRIYAFWLKGCSRITYTSIVEGIHPFYFLQNFNFTSFIIAFHVVRNLTLRYMINDINSKRNERKSTILMTDTAYD